MKIKILDIKTVKDKTWVLAKGNLMEYLNGLKEDFFEFSVQRKIVNNAYLDTIYDSILEDEPLPPITLTYQKGIPANVQGEINVEETQMEILDGLQRTYRLWVILYFAQVINKAVDKSVKTLASLMKQDSKGMIILENSFVTPKFIKHLVEEDNKGKMYIERLMESYTKYDVYFNVWTCQEDNEIIRRMLVLNAGQKSVSSTHQFELLFLHFFEDQKLSFYPEVALIREKDSKYRQVQRGNREKGEYLMSSVVIALQSFINGRQLRISTVNKINLDDNKLLNHEKLEQYFNANTLSLFINKLYELGIKLSCHSEYYCRWYGKDTVLSGIFGAMGSYLIDNGRAIEVEAISDMIDTISKSVDPFKLVEYYDAYNNKLASTKVNVGNAVRKAIFNYTKALLGQKQPDWYSYFDKSCDYDEE